ncbi:MAG: carboxypeptidase-like regulatory domain-containing protein, partial [Ferruginibacter sp.]
MLSKNAKPILKKHCIKFALGLMMMVPLFVFAQVKTITGTVKDDAGKPVKGASVTVKNETTGTQTDGLGKFTLKASTGATLVISIVGYEETQIPVGGKSDYAVFLKQSNNTLGDVVVVGYNHTKKNECIRIRICCGR